MQIKSTDEILAEYKKKRFSSRWALILACSFPPTYRFLLPFYVGHHFTAFQFVYRYYAVFSCVSSIDNDVLLTIYDPTTVRLDIAWKVSIYQDIQLSTYRIDLWQHHPTSCCVSPILNETFNLSNAERSYRLRLAFCWSVSYPALSLYHSISNTFPYYTIDNIFLMVRSSIAVSPSLLPA